MIRVNEIMNLFHVPHGLNYMMFTFTYVFLISFLKWIHINTYEDVPNVSNVTNQAVGFQAGGAATQPDGAATQPDSTAALKVFVPMGE